MNIPNSDVIFSPNQISDDSLFTMNIVSVGSNLQLFEDQVIFLSYIIYDVIGFFETRLDSDISGLYNIPGYAMYSKHRSRHGGGDAVYVSDKHTSNILQDIKFGMCWCRVIVL